MAKKKEAKCPRCGDPMTGATCGGFCTKDCFAGAQQAREEGRRERERENAASKQKRIKEYDDRVRRGLI